MSPKLESLISIANIPSINDLSFTRSLSDQRHLFTQLVNQGRFLRNIKSFLGLREIDKYPEVSRSYRSRFLEKQYTFHLLNRFRTEWNKRRCL
jgi:hypothetical protein